MIQSRQEHARKEFEKWAKKNGIDLEKINSWGQLWRCYVAGYNAGTDKAKEIVKDVFRGKVND